MAATRPRMLRPVLRAPGRLAPFRWLGARAVTARWYPQGIDVGTLRGRRVLAVGWFRQDAQRRHLASRVTLVDLARGRCVDVALAVPTEHGLEPARIHAGGIAWVGDRLLVAATREGVWEFDASRMTRVRGADAARVRASRRGRWHGSTLAVPRTRVHDMPLRCSFLGRTIDAHGAHEGEVMVGEYRTDDDGRVQAFAIPATRDEDLVPLDAVTPGLASMQGVVRADGRILVSQSRGMEPGALWALGDGDPERVAVLPVGCEDLALDVDARVLWTLGEHPWKRVVRALPFAALGIGGGGARRARTATRR